MITSHERDEFEGKLELQGRELEELRRLPVEGGEAREARVD